MRKLIVTVASIVASLAGGASPGWASCAEVATVESGLVSADLVVLGTVTSGRNDARWVDFAIEEVWRGSSPAAIIEVRGGPADAVTSVDRTYVVGERYLLFAQAGDSFWTDDSCSPTRPWTEDLSAFRPAIAAGSPSGGSTTTEGFVGTTGAGGISPSTRDGGLSSGVVTAGLALATMGVIGFTVFRLRPDPSA